MKSIVIIGYGQLGKALGERHLANNDRVFTVSRTHYNASTAQHVPLSVDLDELRTALTLPPTVDCLYYLAPPSDTTLTDARLQNFLVQHDTIMIRHIVYISTSGVYGDSKGAWISEQTPVNPDADRAKRRLHAEQQLTQYAATHDSAVTILRCAAIYSVKTVNYSKIKANTKPVIHHLQAPYTNRIHLDDLTEVCWQAMLQPPLKLEIYNVSDGHPSTTTEHAWLLADLANIPRNPEITLNEAPHYYSPAYLSYLAESKRLDTSKLKQKLKPKLRFENCRDGIVDCLNKSQGNF